MKIRSKTKKSNALIIGIFTGFLVLLSFFYSIGIAPTPLIIIGTFFLIITIVIALLNQEKK